MPIKILQERKKQKSLIIVLAGILVLFFLVLYFGFFKKGNTPLTLSIATPEIREIKIDFEVLESELLRKLESFEWASLPKEKGRENPFIPY